MLLILALTLLPVSYGGSIGASEDQCEPWRILTYNAGLIPFVPNYDTRKTETAQRLREVDADVVCLQEISYEDDMTNIMSDLQGLYPFSYSFLHSTVSTHYNVLKNWFFSKYGWWFGQKAYPCDGDPMIEFLQCVTINCANETGYSLLTCGISICRDQGFALSEECLSCIAGSATTTDMVMAKCYSEGNGLTRYSPEAVMILSKYPILSTERLDFITGVKQIFPRGILSVHVAGLGQVLCTHLTADVSGLGFPYVEAGVTAAMGITTYKEQQKQEIDFIKDMYSEADELILAGDLNLGPAVPSQNVTAVLPEHYAALLEQGFTSAYAETVDANCTYCEDNPIAVKEISIIDHIMLRDHTSSLAKRVLDESPRL